MSGTITRIGATGAGTLLALGLFAAPPAGATGGDRDGKGHPTHATSSTPDGRTQGRSQSDPDGMKNGGADKPGRTGGFDADRDGNNGCGNDADREDDNNGRCGGSKTDKTKVESDKTKVEAEKQESRGDDTQRGRDGRCDKPEGTAVAGASTTSGKCTCPVGSEDEFASGAKVSGSGTVAGSVVKVNATAADAGATAAGVDATVAAAGTTADSATPADATTTVAGATSTAPTTVEAATATTAPGTEVLGESITRPSVLARTGAGVGGLALLGGLLCGGGVLARRFLRIG